jgi:hypothetical protein
MCFHSLVASSSLGPDILLSTPFSSTLNLCFSLRLSDLSYICVCNDDAQNRDLYQQHLFRPPIFVPHVGARTDSRNVRIQVLTAANMEI